VEFRRLRQDDDLDPIIDLAVRGLRPELYPLHLARAKVRAHVEFARDSAADFNLVAFNAEGAPVALGAARIVEMPWFERCEAHVYALFSQQAMAGTEIMKRLLDWYHGNPMVRRLQWPLEYDAPVAMMRLCERLGFNSFHTIACHYKV